MENKIHRNNNNNNNNNNDDDDDDEFLLIAAQNNIIRHNYVKARIDKTQQNSGIDYVVIETNDQLHYKRMQ